MGTKLLYCIYHYLFSPPNNSAAVLAGRSILGKSFRITQGDFIALIQYHKAFLKTFWLVVKSEPGVGLNPIESSPIAIYDSYRNDEKLRTQYIKNVVNTEVKFFIPREELGTTSFPFPKLKTVLGLLILFPSLLPVVLFTKYRKNIVLVFREYAEMMALSEFLGKNEIEHLYHFNIYEKESNFLSYYLKSELNIKTTKCPSEVPLAFWNKTILCDELIICNAYQLDEVKEFSDSMLVENLIPGAPEQAYSVAKEYEGRNMDNPSKFQLGYISTGAWVREKEGHVDQGFQMAKNERMILDFFNRYLKGKSTKLIIYLHPREKGKKYLNESKTRYEGILSDISYEFAPFDKPSSHLFASADLVVSFYSSLLFERLYFGFKTIFYTLFSDSFPIKESHIRNICAFNEKELEKLIDQCLPKTDNQFFAEMNINNYPYLRN